MVLLLYPYSSSADSTRPTWASMKEVEAYCAGDAVGDGKAFREKYDFVESEERKIGEGDAGTVYEARRGDERRHRCGDSRGPAALAALVHGGSDHLDAGAHNSP